MSEETVKTPQVLIILHDNPETGELEIGGVQRPVEFNPKSPAHVVGKWIADNLEQIVLAVSQPRVNEPDVGPSIIGPDREHTIVGVPV